MHFSPLIHSLSIISAAFLLIVPTVQASGAAQPSAETIKLRDFKRPATTVKNWLAQVEAATVTVTGVALEQTEAGLDIILETAAGKPLQVDATKFRAEGNSLIADIPNAVLTLPNAEEFSADNPTEEIAVVRVTQVDAANIRVTVAGKTALPTSEVTLRTGALAYSLNPETDAPDEELVVTGEGQRGYYVPDATTGTRTDTPLRDTPRTIQVVPKQVLQDQAVIRVTDALRNVSGVVQDDGFGGTIDQLNIRGFSTDSVFVDGLGQMATGCLRLPILNALRSCGVLPLFCLVMSSQVALSTWLPNDR